MGRYFTVVGIKYYDYESHKDMIQEGDTVYLRHEPENKFDKNAVIVYFTFDNLKLGYISQQENEYLFQDLERISFIVHAFYSNVIIIEELLNVGYSPFELDDLAKNKKQLFELLEPSQIEKQSIFATVKKLFYNYKKR